MNFVLIKKLQQSIELPDTHPLNQINMLREDWIGLASKCGCNCRFYTGISRRVSTQSGGRRSGFLAQLGRADHPAEPALLHPRASVVVPRYAQAHT